jgi:TusA-related sulfurtransferase
VDARALKCPLPVIRLAQAAREASPGTEILVRSTDPAAQADIPAWCRLRGEELVEVRDEDDHTVHVVRLRQGPR